MSDALATYLQDHLAGAVHAIELVKTIREQHISDPLGQFASNLLIEIEADRDVLRGLAERAGTGSNSVKELTAWLGEKVSRLKLRQSSPDNLGTLEALEFLELGIHGKWALWRALDAVADDDSRLRGTDFEGLSARAESQYEKVEERRLEAARTALRYVRS
jgi:hypothetical protein